MTAVLWKFIKGSHFLTKNKFLVFRCLSAEHTKLTEKDVEEIKIPVPWGHIAGKWWGNKDLPPVLAIHGWQDNANTYDHLLPLLNIQSALVIDLPGHGHSSHLPEGRAYDFGEYVILIHRIKKYLKFEKIPFLTHSFGGVLGLAYASMFPDAVKWIINFECARSLLTVYRNELSSSLSKGVDTLLKIEKQKKETSPPTYKLSKLIEMCINGSLGSIATPRAALVLLKRGIHLVDREPTDEKIAEQSEIKYESDLQEFIINEMQNAELLPENEREKLFKKISSQKENLGKIKQNLKKFKLKEAYDQYYSFNRDPAIKVQVFQSFDEGFILEASKNIKCPFLSIKAKNGFLFGSTKRLYEKTLEILQMNAPYFEHHEVDGTHHAHLNTPENLAPIINKFLEKHEMYNIKPLERSPTGTVSLEKTT